MKSVYKFALDLHEMIAPIRIDAKVGDTARELEISFLERGLPWAIPAGTTATISDGTTTDTTFSVSGETVTWNECFIVNEDKITYRLNGAFTASEGARRLEFKLIGTDGVLYTSTFMLNVYGKVTPDVDPESLTPTTLDDLDEMLQGLQTALEDIDSLKERGYLITGLTVNANHQLVVTMENAEGTEWVYTSDSLMGTVQAFTLKWITDPTDPSSASDVAANVAVMTQIAAATPGQFNVLIHDAPFYFPAVYYGAGCVGVFFPKETGFVWKEISGTTVGAYNQLEAPIINTGTFNASSDFGASQASIADYVAGQIADNTSATAVRGDDPEET